MLEDVYLAEIWSVESNLSRDIKLDEKADDCETILKRHHVNSCSYEERETANWSLDRKGSDCGGNISMFKGDVTINGRPASKGNIGLAKGDVIQTGKQTKLEIKFNDQTVLRLGSNTRLDIDPCHLFFRQGDERSHRTALGRKGLRDRE